MAAADYWVYVSNERSGDISVIDPSQRVVIAAPLVGKRPRGIHLSPDGRLLYVALSGSPRLGPGADPERARNSKADKSADGIGVVDLATRRLVRKLFVGSDPEEFALSRDGRIAYVANEDEARASAWDLEAGRRLFTAAVSDEPEGVALHPQRNEIYVTCEERGEVCVLAGDTGRIIGRFSVRGRPRTIAFSPDGKRAYIPAEGYAEVTVVDTASHRPLQAIAIAGENVLPMDAAVSRDGGELYVSTGRGNSIAVIDTARAAVTATIPVGQRPWGIGLSPDGTHLYSANGASNDVSVVDLHQRKEVARIKVGDGPWGVAIGAK